MKELFLELGYEPNGYGFKKVTENITHWVTVYSSAGTEAYAYYTSDPQGDLIYTTGIMKATPNQVEGVLKVLLSSHK